MMVILEDTDIQTIYDYAITNVCDPCRTCRDSSYCCGCPDKKYFLDTNIRTINKYKVLCNQIDSEIMDKYVVAVERVIDSYNNLMNAYNNYVKHNEDLSKLSEPLFQYVVKHNFSDKLIVKEISQEDI